MSPHDDIEAVPPRPDGTATPDAAGGASGSPKTEDTKPTADTKTPAADTKTPAADTKTPAADTKTPAVETKTHGAAATNGQDAIVYQTGWDPSAGAPAVLLTAVVYCWWLIIGGVFEVLFGGMYLGGIQTAGFHVTTAVQSLVYVVAGVGMVTIAFGILRLQRWTYWAACLLSLVLAGIGVDSIVRWLNGTNITLETAFFAGLTVVFCLYNIYFLVSPGTRQVLHFRLFEGSQFSAGMALCGIVLLLPALSVTLYVNHINKHLSSPVLLLVYTLGFVLMIVMAFMGLKEQRWVWVGAWVWVAIVIWLSTYVILRQLTAKTVDVEGIVFSGLDYVVVVTVIYYLVLEDVRKAVFRDRQKHGLFSPRTLIAGVTLAVCALAIYLLEGQLSQLAVTYAVIGMVMGVVVALLPGADPTNRMLSFVVGTLLAFASYVARGGLLPYTKVASGIVVMLMLLIITGITALFRSRTWFVGMLLGAGIMYGLVEPLFTEGPSAYLAAAGLALAGTLLGFGVGYTVSSLFELELVPYKPTEAEPGPALASPPTGASSAPAAAGHADRQVEAAA